MKLDFRLVDVFTERALAGNQLAVVLNGEGLSEDRMQAIAREFNFSETTFVTPSGRAGCDFRVRIFTPAMELPMAGHPTIGTAVVLAAEGRARDLTTFELGVGPISVRIGAGWAQMTQPNPTFTPSGATTEMIAAALGIEAGKVGLPRLSPELVATGPPFLVVPIADRETLARIAPKPSLWQDLMPGVAHRALYCFTLGGEDPSTSARCRMFAPLDGIAEDPATGSAAGPLGAYLARHAHPGEPCCRFLLEQGYEMGRPSLIEVEIDRSGEEFTAVRVGGPAVIIASGVLEIP